VTTRFTPLGVNRRPHAKITGGFHAFLWKDLDRELKENLRLK
jgi:hypothetical protein